MPLKITLLVLIMLYVQVVKPLPIVYVKYCYREAGWPISWVWSSDTVQETILCGRRTESKEGSRPFKEIFRLGL